MAKPDREDVSHTYRRDTQLLFEILSKTATNAKLCQDLLHDLLTQAELRMIKRRWYIACLLAQDKPVREVADLAGVGTDTVVRMAGRLRESSGALWRAVRMMQPLLERPRPKNYERPTVATRGDTPSSNRWVFGGARSDK